MIMFYKINDKYYVLVGNKYMEVEFTVENGEVQAKPSNGAYVERTANVNAIPQPFDEDFKDKIKSKGKEPEKGFGLNKSSSRESKFRDR